MGIIVDTPMVQIRIIPEGPTVIINVPEPSYLKESYGNLSELLTKVLYKSSQIILRWSVEWTKETDETHEGKDIHELTQWLNTSFRSEFVSESRRFFDWYFGVSELRKSFGIDDFSVEMKPTVEPVPDRPRWFSVTLETETTITFLPVRSVPKYEALWLSKKLTFDGENGLPSSFLLAIKTTHKKENLNFEEPNYRKEHKPEVILFFGTERENYREPPIWSFHLNYETQSVDSETLVRTFKSVEDKLERKPSEGIDDLELLISILPPSYTLTVGGAFFRREYGMDVDKLEQERGSGLSFVLTTLRELGKVLKEMGL